MAGNTETRTASARLNKKKKIFTRKMQARFLLVFCVVFVMFLVLAFRILFLRQRHGVDYTNAVLSHQSYVNTNIPYERGRILDRNGAVLAKNVVTYNVILDPSVVNANNGMYVEPTVEAIIKEMKSGMECGIRLDNFADFVPGDRIEAYDIELKKASR